VNIASDVRWGRTEETYGEDPYLSSEMGVAFVRPFERNGIITTPKHFLANVGDGGRDSYPIHFSERFLAEIHLPPFRACIERGGSRSVMTSYNSIDGSPATASDWLLNKKLKGEWNFTGFVISDASAVGGANVLHFTAPDYPEAGQRAITNGLDVIFQTAWEHHKLFIPPFLNGQIDTKRIDDAVSRVLRAKFELGLFENPYVDEADAARIQMNLHRQLSQEAASKSFVLLKNSNNVLPLSKNIRSIAVIGTDATEARLGGYSGPGNNKVTILQGITEYLGKNFKINHAPGPGREITNWTVIPSTALATNASGKMEAGLTGQYFDNLNFDGKPAVVRTDQQINFHWTLFSPDPALPTDHYAVRWTGKLKSAKTGKYKIGLDGNDGFRLFINGKMLIDSWVKRSYSTKLVEFDFKKNVEYDIRIEFYESQGNAHCRLIWDQDSEDETDKLIAQAVATARQSEIAVIVVGIEEGEFRDRAMLSLPGKQEELILKVVATGKPVVVLLSGGSAITMNKWLDSANAVLNIWYPGEVGGHAVARTLFGDENPAGRLPITYPKHEAQLPLVYNHKPTGRGDDYNNLTGLPLFPFGYGLSYTRFEYTNIKLNKQSIRAGDSVIVRCSVANIGDRDGDEVVQLYIRDLLSSVARPVLELKSFQRIHLRKGETRELSFTITPSMLTMLNEEMKSVIEPGDFRIMIGSSSRDLWLKETLRVE
jgi:beta-glucosidase